MFIKNVVWVYSYIYLFAVYLWLILCCKGRGALLARSYGLRSLKYFIEKVCDRCFIIRQGFIFQIDLYSQYFFLIQLNLFIYCCLGLLFILRIVIFIVRFKVNFFLGILGLINVQKRDFRIDFCGFYFLFNWWYLKWY